MSINATVDGTVYEGIQTISVGGKSVVLSEIGGSGEITRASWHQCPEVVRTYLAAAQAAYPSDDNVTVIDQYAPSQGNEVTANTKPVGYTIDGVTFRDNEPLVATPFATANKAGTLTALDKLRWYNTTYASSVPGREYPRGVNCRDLGGWACDGGTVRYGMLVRGSEPNPADKELMVDKIGIRTEVQILPVPEQSYQLYSPWGIDWAGNDTTDKFYDGLNNKPLWRKLLTAIMDSVIHSKPVYFHCGIGADRTGIVAMCLEAMLGVSRADIDQDYELTNFAFGWKTLDGGVFRSRVYSTQVALNAAINSVPLANGLTDSYRNRWVSFVLSCGISIDKINAFRSACIDGTPDVITIIVPTYTISKSGSHVAYDNDTASVRENDPYSVGVTPASGYVISDVSVTMGGADITSQVFSGTPTVRRVGVTNNLLHCSTSNSANVVEEGAAYTATITAAEGYTLDGATVQIAMGGVNVSQYYSNGTINIPNVTGNVVISVTAVESVRVNLFDASAAHYNAWLGSTQGDVRTGGTGNVVTNMIQISNIAALEIEGVTLLPNSGVYATIYLYPSSEYTGKLLRREIASETDAYNINLAALKSEAPTATHAALVLHLSNSDISTADTANLAIYGS